MRDTLGVAIYRTPDGRPLEITPGGLTVLSNHGVFRDPPGGLTAHPQVLQPFLQNLDELLDREMDDAEHNGELDVQALEHLIDSVLLGQAIGIGLAAYAHGGRGDLLELLNDLIATLDRISVLGTVLRDRMPSINAAAGCAWLDGVRLLRSEYPHAVGRLLDEAQGVGRTPTPQEQRRLDWAGYRQPRPVKDPLRPGWRVLAPPITRLHGKLGDDQRLRELARHGHEPLRNAALLLLHIHGRDRLENVPVVDVLDTARMLLDLKPSEDGAAHHDLITLHDTLHADLGRPELPRSRRHRRAPDGNAEAHTWRARRLLRALRSERLHPVASPSLDTLWDALNMLERLLEAGHDPHDDPALKARLILLALRGLVSTYRAPGMALPPMVQLAAQVSGIDPLWAWERTQPRGEQIVDLQRELAWVSTTEVLLAVWQDAGDQTLAREAARLMRLAAGHLLATVRRAGIRLPEQDFLEDQFRGSGILSALPLSTAAQATLQRNLDTLLQRWRRPEAPEPDVPVEVSGEPLSPPPPGSVAAPPDLPALGQTSPHVEAARRYLQGRRMVLLGGVPSAAHRDALMSALGLAELDWIASSDYAHGSHAHARVTTETAVVILAIRWMAHAHAALRDVARDKKVPIVMHPGGLSPNSVAWQIMQQVSQKLEQRTTES